MMTFCHGCFDVFCLIQFQWRMTQQQIASIQKMVDFTFQGLFMTTNKGIPDLDNLAASTTLARPYYTYSILLQSVLLLLFILYFALSIFRVTKKIKNSKFEEVMEQEEATNKNATERNGENENQNENEKEDKLVYQFDDEEEEEEEKEAEEHGDPMEKSENLEKSQKKVEEKAEEENYDEYHDQNEESFIELDRKLLFLQPFLIPFVVCNGLFAADPFTIILLVLTIVCYIAFNIKKKLDGVKIAPFLFMICSLLAFVSFFYNDHDLTT